MPIDNMSIDVSSELIVFLQFIVSGVISGIIADIQKKIIRVNKDKTLIVLSDIVVWYLLALIIFYYMFTYNDGQYRFYVILSMAIGFFIYKMCLSNLTEVSINKIGTFIIKFIIVILKILLTPILFLYKIILYFKHKLIK